MLPTKKDSGKEIAVMNNDNFLLDMVIFVFTGK